MATIDFDLEAALTAALPRATKQTIWSLSQSADLVPTQGGDVLYRQGEWALLTMVVEGHLAFRHTTVDGRQLTVWICEPGNLYGLSSIEPVESSVDLIAINDGLVATWPASTLGSLVSTDPGLAHDIIAHLAVRMQTLTEHVDGFLHQNSRRRVIRVLTRYRHLFVGEPPVLDRSHLPALVGTSREMTGHVLRELEAEGVVARHGRRGLRLIPSATFEVERPAG
jgi:CRP/FNR family transcriptional regulator, cyclic AMP receptor protein